MDTLTRPAPPVPDAADVLAAGRPYPMRETLAPLTPRSARSLLLDRWSWWLDVRQGCLDLAQAAVDARDLSGAREALDDAADAGTKAAWYAPESAR